MRVFVVFYRFAKIILFGFGVCVVLLFKRFLVRHVRLNKFFTKIISYFVSNLGVVFVKIAQSLSLKPYLIGNEIALVLANMQEKAFSSHKNINFITKLVNHNIKKHSYSIEFTDKKPISSGSIADVYKAILINTAGQRSDVAIKIVKTWLKKQTILDISIILLISKFLHKFKRFKSLDLPTIVLNIKQIIEQEFDMGLELVNSYKLKQNLIFKENIFTKKYQTYPFYIPQTFDNISSNNILIQQWIDGFSLANTKQIEDLTNQEKQKICKSIILLYLEQVYNDGCFHADLHPGNIIYNQSNKVLYLIDCGNISTISKNDRITVAKILYFFLQKQYKNAALEYIKAGYISADVNIEAFSSELENLANKTITNVGNRNVSSIIANIMQITHQFDLKTQPQLLMLQKTILYIEGCVYKVDSNFDVWHIIKPWMRTWAFKNSSISVKLKSIAKAILNKIFNLQAKE